MLAWKTSRMPQTLKLKISTTNSATAQGDLANARKAVSMRSKVPWLIPARRLTASRL